MVDILVYYFGYLWVKNYVNNGVLCFSIPIKCYIFLLQNACDYRLVLVGMHTAAAAVGFNVCRICRWLVVLLCMHFAFHFLSTDEIGG